MQTGEHIQAFERPASSSTVIEAKNMFWELGEWGRLEPDGENLAHSCNGLADIHQAPAVSQALSWVLLIL